MDFDVLVHKLANQKGWNLLYLKDEDRYRLQLETTGDRRQDVYVSFRKDEREDWIAVIWSVLADVADFNLSDPKELLRFNWRNVWGKLALVGDDVVLVQHQLTDEANWNEVGRAVEEIGALADSVEAQIYGDADSR